MIRDHLEETVTTDDSFQTALGELLGAALDNGVDPRGSWVHRGADGEPDLETLIAELDESADG